MCGEKKERRDGKMGDEWCLAPQELRELCCRKNRWAKSWVTSNLFMTFNDNFLNLSLLIVEQYIFEYESERCLWNKIGKINRIGIGTLN